MKHSTFSHIRPNSARMTAVILIMTSFGGVAHADQVNVTQTGPDSNQNVTTNTNSTTDQTVTNDIWVSNLTLQKSETGSVNTSYNTNAGGSGGTGQATTAANTTTTIGVVNPSEPSTTGTGGMGAGGGEVAVSGGGDGQVLGSASDVGGRGGGPVASTSPGLGGSGSGVTLPEVGAAQAVDVAAIRNLPAPFTQQPTSGGGSPLAGFLLPMSVISLLAGFGTWLIQRRHLFGKA